MCEEKKEMKTLALCARGLDRIHKFSLYPLCHIPPS